LPPRPPTAAAGYRLVARSPDGASVWDVVAKAEPAFLTLAGFSPPQRTPQGDIGYTFVAESQIGAVELAARTPSTVRLFFEAVPPAGKTSVLQIGDSQRTQTVNVRGRTPVSIVVHVPRGQSELLVKTADPIVISTPRTEPSSAQPTLHADLVSPNPGF
jgi:hypothetical protein